ncbi:hypothetical protein MY3296_009868 [Beauveria thailandica]
MTYIIFIIKKYYFLFKNINFNKLKIINGSSSGGGGGSVVGISTE